MANKDVAVAAFVMPVFLEKGEQSVRWLDEAVDSILAQTDPNWQLVMVDDASPLPGIESVLENIRLRDDRIHVIKSKLNQGPGVARNIGIGWAHENGLPITLFLDSDDIAHPKRLETVREAMSKDSAVGVLYSTFKVIDEDSRDVEWDKLSAPIKEILVCNQQNPPQGETAWIDIGTSTGYANLTSSTSVRTNIAYKYPFPAVAVSEDAHAWLRYSAEGKKFVYDGSVPTLYRIPQNVVDTSSRDRVGGVDVFYAQKCKVDEDGFTKAIAIALQNGKIKASTKDKLMTGFHVRMAKTMQSAGQVDLAKIAIEKAHAISICLTREWANYHEYDRSEN